jgi:hypothetical protein
MKHKTRLDCDVFFELACSNSSCSNQDYERLKARLYSKYEKKERAIKSATNLKMKEEWAIKSATIFKNERRASD